MLRISLHAHGLLDAIVEDEHKSTASASDDVGQAALEERSDTTLVGIDLAEAVHGAVVQLVLASLAGGHHESPPDGVKRVGDDTSEDGDELGEHPLREDVRLGGTPDQLSAGVVQTEVGSTVADNADDGDAEAGRAGRHHPSAQSSSGNRQGR